MYLPIFHNVRTDITLTKKCDFKYLSHKCPMFCIISCRYSYIFLTRYSILLLLISKILIKNILVITERVLPFIQKNAEVEDSEKESSHAAATHPSDVLDMPVDPNEPTYCLCHQVSYGEMIGCDNPDVSTYVYTLQYAKSILPYQTFPFFVFQCPIEWFHFACVGLTTKPKGKWFCPKCTQDRKKK